MDWRRDGDGNEDGNCMSLLLLLSTCDSGEVGIGNDNNDKGDGSGSSGSNTTIKLLTFCERGGRGDGGSVPPTLPRLECNDYG